MSIHFGRLILIATALVLLLTTVQTEAGFWSSMLPSNHTTELDQQARQSTTPSQSFGSSFSQYGTRILSVAGIQPASIANLLNTVGDTGFRYFNIQDQCRNRAACDLGFMLFKKLSFLHNWLIRTSVRTLTDMNNIYTQSWMEGMVGRNCTIIYATCRESPLEGLINLAMLQQMSANNAALNQANIVAVPVPPTTTMPPI